MGIRIKTSYVPRMIPNDTVKTTRKGAVRALILLPITGLLGACNAIVLHPAGDVALQQRDELVISTLLMLLIIVPVMVLTVIVAWRYRESNTEATYAPDWDHSTSLELVIWSAPLLIIICLGALTWLGTHTLDPYRPTERLDAGRPVDAKVAPLEVDVVAMDWKWLFFYPQYGIATVNQLALPVDRPIDFHITATSVMNSFYIPALAGQIYAMPGMETRLHAVLNHPGNFVGFSANYSGAGFSGMHFATLGTDSAGFDRWVQGVRGSNLALSNANYLRLEQPSEDVKPMAFSSYAPNLFARVLNMCEHPGDKCIANMMHADMMKDMDVAGPAAINDTGGGGGAADATKGAIFKSPEEKGSSPNVTVPPTQHPPGNAAPGSDKNRGMS
jgi:cytochrome o ubiquinol oxidase subunit 2